MDRYASGSNVIDHTCWQSRKCLNSQRAHTQVILSGSKSIDARCVASFSCLSSYIYDLIPICWQVSAIVLKYNSTDSSFLCLYMEYFYYSYYSNVVIELFFRFPIMWFISSWFNIIICLFIISNHYQSFDEFLSRIMHIIVINFRWTIFNIHWPGFLPYRRKAELLFYAIFMYAQLPCRYVVIPYRCFPIIIIVMKRHPSVISLAVYWVA